MRTKRKRRGQNTRLGRALRRLFGETAGGVMMEYVVLGLLVVAAVAVVVIAFGGTISGVFQTMIDSMTGRNQKARTSLEATRTRADTDMQNAETHRGVIQRGDEQRR